MPGIKPKVYVTQESKHDFSSAESFGELDFLTHEDLNNTKGSLHNEAILQTIRAKLRRFDPDVDFILVAGSPYITAAVFMLLGRMQYRNIRILRWSNRDLRYQPLHLELTAAVIA